MHHPVCGINSLILSVSLDSHVSTHLLIYLSAHLYYYHHSHHPSLLHSFTPGSKPTFSTNPSHLRFLLPDTIRYDSVYLTCSKKLTGSQLSPPHGTNKKLKCETKNKTMSMIGPVQSRCLEGSPVGKRSLKVGKICLKR